MIVGQWFQVQTDSAGITFTVKPSSNQTSQSLACSVDATTGVVTALHSGECDIVGTSADGTVTQEASLSVEAPSAGSTGSNASSSSSDDNHLIPLVVGLGGGALLLALIFAALARLRAKGKGKQVKDLAGVTAVTPGTGTAVAAAPSAPFDMATSMWNRTANGVPANAPTQMRETAWEVVDIEPDEMTPAE